MMVRSVGPEEVGRLCATRDVVTFLSESAEGCARDLLGLSTDSQETSKDRHVYLKQELTSDVDLLRRLCADRSHHTVVGIGSGWLCDIAKIVGHHRRTVLVPSALTQNGPFTHKAVADERFMALVEPPSRSQNPGRREERHSVVTGFPDEVLICYNLLQRPGNTRFTRAGLGDPLSSITGIFDNELADRDITEPERRRWHHADLHPEINDEAREMVRRISNLAPEIKANTLEGIDMIVTALRASARWHYHAQRAINGGEHSFAEAAEEIIRGKGLLALHGELLSVGILCVLHLQGRHDEIAPTRDLFRALGLPVSHTAIGLTQEETLQALRDAVDCRPDKYGILNTVEDPAAFEHVVSEVFEQTLTKAE
jgi:glycerol dehydrogenase-like iron-containing ADH family enzyme